MINYQYTLRDENSRKLAMRKADTSFLLFPIRLETKFKDQKLLDDIHEPDRVYYVFCAVWAVLRLLKGSPEAKVLKKISLLKKELEGLDLIYKEDKALLRNLLKEITSYLSNERIKDAWTPLLTLLENVSTADSVVDKKTTLFLNELEKMTRKLKNTVKNPPFSGSRRLDRTSQFSQTVFYRTALKRYKECVRFMACMDKRIESIPYGMLNDAQIVKFSECLHQWLSLDEKDFLWIYQRNLNGYSWEESAVQRNYNRAYDALKCYVEKKFIPAWQNMNFSRLSDKFCQKKRILDKKGTQVIQLKRYTVLASSLMHLYLRCYIGTSKTKDIQRINSLCRNTYFNYKSEKNWVVGLLQLMNRLFELDLKLDYVNENDHTIHRSHMDYQVKEKCLCVRIYPDVVAITQMVKPLSEEEFEVGKDFWLKYVYTADKEYRASLWLGICDLYEPHRAAYILKQCYPGKENYMKLERQRKFYNELDAFVNQFVKDENIFKLEYTSQTDELFSVPVTDLMPSRFMLHANLNVTSGRKYTIWRCGHRLPSQLQVGLDLNHLENAVDEKKSQQSAQLYLNGNLRWMTDYEEAERMGMAITVPLKMFRKGRKRQERVFDFDSIYVYGIQDASDDECTRMLQDLLTSRLYSKQSFGLINSDMPTNILAEEDESYLYDSSVEAQKERFKMAADRCVHPESPQTDEDVLILKNLFGLSDNLLSDFDERDASSKREVQLARKVNKVMLDLLGQDYPLLKVLKENDELATFFTNDVLPRGAYPFFRVGNQPYGILPACDIRYLKFPEKLEMLRAIVVYLTHYWNTIVENEHVAYDGSKCSDLSDTDYLNMLNSTPATSTIWKRKMLKSNLINPEYFRREFTEKQLDSLTKLYNASIPYNYVPFSKERPKKKYKEISKKDLERYLINYQSVPLLDAEDDEVAPSVIMAGEHPEFPVIMASLRKDISEHEASDDKLRQYIVEFFDLFNYRLDAWLMGLLNYKIRTRSGKNNHKLSLGCFGWIFNLKESVKKDNSKKNEYILAPSVNQAITAAVLRSSYNNSLKNKERDYSMSVNLSSERVRSAIRIIEGIRNGLSIGCILGSDLERLIHEAYKPDSRCELDACIYPLRCKYPLVSQYQGEQIVNEITVMNGASLLKDYQHAKDKLSWLKGFKLFDGQYAEVKYAALLQLIDRVDDEYDALTDVVLSESVYKLTQGNTDAVDALMRAMEEMKNIPMPDVVNIPITSAQVDAHMVVALNVDAQPKGKDVLSNVEPKVDAWIEQMIGTPAEMGVAFASTSPSGDSVLDYVSLGKLGISASEMVYLSANAASFDRLLKTLYWLKEGVYPQVDRSVGASEWTLQEVQLAADDMRKLLSESRMLRNEDMVKETGHDSHAVYDTKSSSYDWLKDTITQLVGNMQGMLSEQASVQIPTMPDYNRVAMPDDFMLKAVKVMVECFRLGQFTALDGVDDSLLMGQKKLIANNQEWLATVGRQHTFFQQMNTVCSNLMAKLAEAKSIVDEAAIKNHTVYMDAISHLLVADFLIVPAFQPDERVDGTELVRQCTSNCFTNIDSMGIERFLSDVSTVEQPMMYLHQLRMYGKCNDLDIPEILPVQFPSIADQNMEWLGTEVSDSNWIKDAFVYLVMNPDTMVASMKKKDEAKIAGIVVDHWIERIPYKNQTAAVAFNYDQPDAEPPQSLLLAVSAYDEGQLWRCWSDRMMINTMKSAIHMVKCRAVNPEMISNQRWLSGIFPLVEYKDKSNNK